MAKDSPPRSADTEDTLQDRSNVTSINTPYQHRFHTRRLLMGLASLLAAAAVLVAAVLFVIYRDRLSLDRIRRRLADLNIASSSGTVREFTYETHRSNVFAMAGSNLVIGSVSGLTVFGTSGTTEAVIQQATGSPCLRTGTDSALLADLGRTSAGVINLSEDLSQTIQTDQPILAADMAQNGSFCLLTSADGCKATVHVYSPQAQEIYQWRSATYYLTLAALSDDGSLLAALAAGTLGADSRSVVQILHTDTADGPIEVDLGSENILFLDWMGDSLAVFGQTQLAVISQSGAVLGRFGYDGRSLKALTVCSDFAAAVFDAGSSDGQSLLTAISPDGTLLGQMYPEGSVRALSASGNRLAVTTDTTVTLLDSSLETVCQWTDLSAGGRALVRSDGSVLYVSGGRAAVYVPE